MSDKRMLKILWAYVAGSLLAIPGLLYLSTRFFPKQIACFDLEKSTEYYLLQDGGPRIFHSDVVQQYYASALFLGVSAGLMIVIGLLFMRLLLGKHVALSKRQKGRLSIVVAVTVGGHGLVLVLAIVDAWCASI